MKQVIADWCCIIALVVAIFAVTMVFSGCALRMEVALEDNRNTAGTDDAVSVRAAD